MDQDAIMALLSARRRDKLAETLESQKTDDVETDVVTLLYLPDLVEIVKNTDELRSRL